MNFHASKRLIFSPIGICLSFVCLTQAEYSYKEPFSRDLFFNAVTSEKTANVLISPASVYICLGLAYLGAGNKTKDELNTVLHLKGHSSEAVGESYKNYMNIFEDNQEIEFNMANRIFISDQLHIKPKFTELSEKHFKSTAEKVKFSDRLSAADRINSWIGEATKNKINCIVSSSAIDDCTAAILVNAIHFKAKWRHQFHDSHTKKVDFFNTATFKVPVDMMYRQGLYKYAEWPELDATAIQIPYSHSSLYMLIVLPKSTDGLVDLERKFSTVDDEILRGKFQDSTVAVHLPKFKFEFEIQLNEILEKMGLGEMFSGHADFSEMIESVVMPISQIKHKAFISVAENGTEAAGATAVLGSKYGHAIRIPDVIYEFKADHPFMFAIKDNDVVYFAGHVTHFGLNH